MQMEDNARKFIVDIINPDFLKKNNAVSFLLIANWLITQEESEKKVVYKRFDNGEIQFLLVEKVTNGGNRSTNKKKLAETEYNSLVGSSTVHLEKKRHEFNFTQNTVAFTLKYDEFDGGKLRMMEVDASSADERSNFKTEDFPYKLIEVTGDMRYYGYRVIDMV
jgi:hypothetical protein